MFFVVGVHFVNFFENAPVGLVGNTLDDPIHSGVEQTHVLGQLQARVTFLHDVCVELKHELH